MLSAKLLIEKQSNQKRIQTFNLCSPILTPNSRHSTPPTFQPSTLPPPPFTIHPLALNLTQIGLLCTTMNVFNVPHSTGLDGSAILISKFHTMRATMSRISAQASSRPMQRRGPRLKGWMAEGLWLMMEAGRGSSQRSGRKVSGWEKWEGWKWMV